MQKIRKGDEVVVLSGKDKGRRGAVLRIMQGGQALLIDGINRVKKHQKPNPMKGQAGGIVEQEMPIHISNIGLFNLSTQAADRVGFKDAGGRKVRYFKSSGEVVDV
jgi:large subunit ribosomal protein L24